MIFLTTVLSTSPETRKQNELLSRKIKAENELLYVDAELWRLDHNRTPLPEPDSKDIAPPIPDTKEGAFSFVLNICWWAVYIAFKLAGYAVLIWFVWTVLTA